MKNNLMISSDQYDYLKKIKTNQNIKSNKQNQAIKNNLQKNNFLDVEGQLTDQGIQAYQKFHQYLINDNKADNILADIFIPAYIVFVIFAGNMIYLLLNITLNLHQVSTAWTIIGLIVSVIVLIDIIVARPIVSHIINKHYHLS